MRGVLQPTRLFDHLRQSRGSVQDQAYEKGDAGVVGKARRRGAHVCLPVPCMAVLVTGFIRSWSQVHDAFVENILDANPPGSVDVFFYVPFDGEDDNGAATESEKDRLAGGTGESGGEKEAAEAERIQCEHAALEKMRSMPGAVVETYRLHDPVTGDPAVERNHPQYGRCVAPSTARANTSRFAAPLSSWSAPLVATGAAETSAAAAAALVAKIMRRVRMAAPLRH